MSSLIQEILYGKNTDNNTNTNNNNKINDENNNNKLINREIEKDQKQLKHKKKEVGYVYDPRMVNHSQLNLNFYENEIPLRISAIYQTLVHNGFIEKMKHIPARLATNEELLLFHTPEYIKEIEKVKDLTKDELIRMSKLYDDIYLCSESEYCARLACGGVIELINEILLDKILSGFAIVRPPGHHAEANQAMGFCIFNNVAVAVASLKKKYNLNKILIVDWDVHYGNGIQKAFDNDPNVVYISLHRYEEAQFYPFDTTGALGYVGEAGGLGSTINIAWPRSGMGDGDYLYAFDEIVIPIVKEFKPEVIVVAAGFDAAEGDQLGECHITPVGYAQLTHKLSEVANGKLAICLEGGYNLQSISKSAMACVQVLLKEIDVSNAYQSPPSNDCVDVVDGLKRIHKIFWNCMQEAYDRRLEESAQYYAKQAESEAEARKQFAEDNLSTYEQFKTNDNTNNPSTSTKYKTTSHDNDSSTVHSNNSFNSEQYTSATRVNNQPTTESRAPTNIYSPSNLDFDTNDTHSYNPYNSYMHTNPVNAYNPPTSEPRFATTRAYRPYAAESDTTTSNIYSQSAFDLHTASAHSCNLYSSDLNSTSINSYSPSSTRLHATTANAYNPLTSDLHTITTDTHNPSISGPHTNNHTNINNTHKSPVPISINTDENIDWDSYIDPRINTDDDFIDII